MVSLPTGFSKRPVLSNTASLLSWNMPTSWVSMTGGQTAWSKHTSSPWHTAVMGESWWCHLAGEYPKRPGSSGPDSVHHTEFPVPFGTPSTPASSDVLLLQTPMTTFCSKRIPLGPALMAPTLTCQMPSSEFFRPSAGVPLPTQVAHS